MSAGGPSIHRSVSRVLLLVVSLAVLMSAAGSTLLMRATYRQRAESQLSTLAGLAGQSVSSSVFLRNTAEVEAALQVLLRDSELDQAHIFELGTLSHFAGVPASSPPPSDLIAKGPGLYDSSPGVWLVRELRDERERPIALIALHSSLDNLRQEQNRMVLLLALVSLLMLLVTWWAAHQLNRNLTRPILSLVDAVSQIEARRDHSLRVRPEKSDEIGRLGNSINTMLASLELQASALRASESRFRQMAETIAEVFRLVELDPEAGAKAGRIVYLSPSFESLWGQLRLDFTNMEQWLQTVHPADRPAVEKSLCGPMLKAGVDLEFRIVRPDGSERWVHDRAFPIVDASGKVSRVVAVSGDVTARRSAETQRQELESQLRRSQRLESLGTLAGGIAHDFNNLLTAILGNAELAALAEQDRDAATHHVNEIQKAGRRARDLVQRILTFSRKSEVSLKRTALSPIVEEAVGLLRSSLPASVDLRLEFASDLPQVVADPSQIHQVVVNLVTNSWHALHDRPGTIDVQLFTVDGSTVPRERIVGVVSGRSVCLEVRDNGVGMEAAVMERVFEPFFTTKPAGQGTGLGLSMVLGIVQSHGGAIQLESVQGEGSCFRLFFPAAEGSAVRGAEAPGAQTQGRGERILYVDDEPALVELAVTRLMRLGYQARGVASPEQALQWFREHPGTIDLVITDLSMPGVSGIELARMLRSIDPAVRVMVTSGYLREDEARELDALGISEVLIKPHSLDQMAEAVGRVFTPQP